MLSCPVKTSKNSKPCGSNTASRSSPRSPGIERTLFDELVAAAWKLRRAQRLETELLFQFDDLLASLDDDKLQKKLDNLARHKTRIERTFHRSLKELKALQTNRLQHNLFFHIREPFPGLADMKPFAKQTHPLSEESEIDPEALEHIIQMRQRRAEFAKETDEIEAMLAAVRAEKGGQIRSTQILFGLRRGCSAFSFAR